MLKTERASQADLEQILELAAARREKYSQYQPQFWRPAAGAVALQRPYFASLIEDDNCLVVVTREDSDVRGFVIARTAGAPPVYDPGGLSCDVDDFAVADPEQWPVVGPLLLDAVRAWGSDRGATQLIVVVAQLDEAKRAVLKTAQLTTASEWWVGSIRP